MELMLIVSFLFISYSPLILVLVFIFYLLVAVILMIYILNSYFYSYLIFLLFISGLLIMLMYLCSVILNEKLYMFDVKNILFFISLFLLLSTHSFDIIEDFHILKVLHEFGSLLKFFTYSYNMFSLFFILYLFFCLMIVYELLKGGKSPLRFKS